MECFTLLTLMFKRGPQRHHKRLPIKKIHVVTDGELCFHAECSGCKLKHPRLVVLIIIAIQNVVYNFETHTLFSNHDVFNIIQALMCILSASFNEL